jgi:hypothetical protein
VPSPTTTVALAQPSAGRIGQLRPPLDRDPLGRELGEHGRLISGSGADVEDAAAGDRPQRGGHGRDHVRLGDRLALADRKGPILVGVFALARGGEQMSRHAPHRVENERGAHAAALDLTLHHPRPSRSPVWFSHVR